MKIILKEIKNNFRKNHLYITYLIISIFLCFMIFAYAKKVENKKLENYNKYTRYIIPDPEMNFQYISDLSDNENIKGFNLAYEFPYSNDFIGEDSNSEQIDSIVHMSEEILLVKNSFTSFQDGKAQKILSDKYEIAIPKDLSVVKNIKIGDKLKIKNLQVEVKGYTDLLVNDSFIGNA